MATGALFSPDWHSCSSVALYSPLLRKQRLQLQLKPARRLPSKAGPSFQLLGDPQRLASRSSICFCALVVIVAKCPLNSHRRWPQQNGTRPGHFCLGKCLSSRDLCHSAAAQTERKLLSQKCKYICMFMRLLVSNVTLVIWQAMWGYCSEGGHDTRLGPVEHSHPSHGPVARRLSGEILCARQ